MMTVLKTAIKFGKELCKSCWSLEKEARLYELVNVP